MVVITLGLLIVTDPVLTAIGGLMIPVIVLLSHFYNQRANGCDESAGVSGGGLRCGLREL